MINKELVEKRLSFDKYWNQNYTKCPPVNYYLRECYPDLWFRIHTLPSSKRYAETEVDKREILNRHNLILTDLLGENTEFILITTGYSSSSLPVQYYSQLNTLAKDSEFLFSIPKHEYELDDIPNFWHFFIEVRTWQENSTDILLNLVANEEINDILFVGVEQNCVYCPYDGGADVFIQDASKRELLETKYSSWRSEHHSGL
jgi:hypothetical protein